MLMSFLRAEVTCRPIDQSAHETNLAQGSRAFPLQTSPHEASSSMPKSREFVESSDSDSDSDVQTKRSKKEKVSSKPAKKARTEASTSKPAARAQESESDNNMFQLSKMRYVSVREFKGKVLVDVREYYDKDGDMKPTKKGISLAVDQWARLKELMPDIDAAVKKM
ncbi:activated RNA polymerase II transcriptional coactivator p15 isoform X1 [Lethenteron reissneri]|uniref:activated RNA polymerase II transcriptional coactivator p15 isoform X1 n=1 Tax=Lethenteron reissneri TaxID=7753 RepID=UPI002AB627FE|nr:activated RNA polymerase II transcriptional coactivator p15 isoform X1 [Lethenteron reissneri]